MKEIIFVKKENVNKGLQEEEVIRIFENSIELEQIKQAVENATDRLYATWISVDATDNAGESIPIEDVITNQDVLMKRGGPVSDTHTNKIVGKTLAYKVLEHPESKTLGVIHLEKIYDDNPADNLVWGEIIDGTRTGSSVGGVSSSMSLSKDKATGKPTKVLEEFAHMETASVEKPCNPFATNIAYSVVAKSNSCISEDTKTDENQETVINKEESNNNNNPNLGDIMENEDIKKTISDIADVVKGIALEVSKLKKEDVPEDTEPVEEAKKEDTPVEEKPKEEEKPVAKEDAASDIDGETSAPAPETPVEDQSNDADVFKAVEAVAKSVLDIKKELKSLVVTKSQTPAAPVADVKKNSNLAMDLAMGKKTMTHMEVQKALKKGE